MDCGRVIMKKKSKKKIKKKAAAAVDDRRPLVSEGNFATADNGLSGNRVFVSMAKTINIGNYESIRVEYGFGRVVSDGQRFDEVRRECEEDVVGCLHSMVEVVEHQLKNK